jgi:spore coat polysaccharide biosynthesis protein SpsF
MDRVLVILQARMGSERLPGKALASIGGAPVLRHCLERLTAAGVGRLILATTIAPEDDQLVEEAATLDVAAVRGSRDDVLGRFVQAVNEHPCDVVIRATADNPAVDLDAPRRTLDALHRVGADYCIERGLPVGSAVEAVRTAALIDISRRTVDAADREHVTIGIRRRCHRYRVHEVDAPAIVRRPDLRLTIDTCDDLRSMRDVIDALPRPLAHAPLCTIIDAADTIAAKERVA